MLVYVLFEIDAAVAVIEVAICLNRQPEIIRLSPDSNIIDHKNTEIESANKMTQSRFNNIRLYQFFHYYLECTGCQPKPRIVTLLLLQICN